MRLPELLVALALLIFGFGLRRAFQHPTEHRGSVKAALSVWLVLLVAGFLVWSWASRHSSVRPDTLKITHESARTLS
jgi:uncharacterized membrane protein YozB (DUF420 family)